VIPGDAVRPTNLFKANVTAPFPSFHTRKPASGFLRTPYRADAIPKGDVTGTPRPGVQVSFPRSRRAGGAVGDEARPQRSRRSGNAIYKGAGPGLGPSARATGTDNRHPGRQHDPEFGRTAGGERAVAPCGTRPPLRPSSVGRGAHPPERPGASDCRPARGGHVSGPVAYGRRLGQGVEDMTRVSHYLGLAATRGSPPEAAAESFPESTRGTTTRT